MKLRKSGNSRKNLEIDSVKLAYLCANKLYENLAEDIHILDLQGLTNISDFFVIASANSKIHLKALAEEIEELFRDIDLPKYHIEGMEALNWVLADAYDVIVHLFMPDARQYYDIESYWGDAPVEILKSSDKNISTIE